MSAKERPRRRHRIVVIRALGLGDLLTAVPALRALRRGFPESEITLAAPVQLAPLVPLIGAVDSIVDTPDLDAVRANGAAPDLVVNLHGSGPESIEAALRLAPAELLSHSHPSYPALSGPQWRAELHEIDRWCELTRWAGLSTDRFEYVLDPAPVPPLQPGVIVVHPGASAAARRWPADRFAAVAAAVADGGVPVLITGSSTERGLADRVAARARHPRVRSVAGQLGLGGLAALVSAAALVVCGDTGTAHLATAYRTPSVVLFGPTPPALWGPPAWGPHRTIWHGSSGDPHAARPDPGLLEIGVDEVLAAVRSVSSGSTGRVRARLDRATVFRHQHVG
ncbi:glycosyltransferase family 9 protein [Microlunatus ginsengisoli]